MLIVSVRPIVWSNCHILQFYIRCLTCPPCCWTTHLSQRAGNATDQWRDQWRRENVTFIEHDMWPPNTPNLNPVDSAIGVLFNRWSINVNDSRQSTSWSRRSSLSGANYRSLSLRHWSVASPAWVRRPAARQTHWTSDVKLQDVSYFRQ